MLGGVRQMRAAVLHLGDLRVRIVRVGPVRVRALLLAGPVEPGQLGARRRREAGRLGQPGQKRVVALARIPPHNAPHRRIGFQRRGIDANRAPHHQRGVGQSLQHPRKHCLVGLEVNQATVSARVPHPVSWTHIYATRLDAARVPRALRAACGTPASRGASTDCSVRRTRRRRCARRPSFGRPGRRLLAP